MNIHRIRHQTDEFGTVWFVFPLMWAAVALIGCALIAHWPGLFAEQLPQQAAVSAALPAAGNAATSGSTP